MKAIWTELNMHGGITRVTESSLCPHSLHRDDSFGASVTRMAERNTPQPLVALISLPLPLPRPLISYREEAVSINSSKGRGKQKQEKESHKLHRSHLTD